MFYNTSKIAVEDRQLTLFPLISIPHLFRCVRNINRRVKKRVESRRKLSRKIQSWREKYEAATLRQQRNVFPTPATRPPASCEFSTSPILQTLYTRGLAGAGEGRAADSNICVHTYSLPWVLSGECPDWSGRVKGHNSSFSFVFVEDWSVSSGEAYSDGPSGSSLSLERRTVLTRFLWILACVCAVLESALALRWADPLGASSGNSSSSWQERSNDIMETMTPC